LGGIPAALGPLTAEFGTIAAEFGLLAAAFGPTRFELGAPARFVVALGWAFALVDREPGRVAAALGPVLGTVEPVLVAPAVGPALPAGPVVLVAVVAAGCAKAAPDASRPTAVAAPMDRSLMRSSPDTTLAAVAWASVNDSWRTSFLSCIRRTAPRR